MTLRSNKREGDRQSMTVDIICDKIHGKFGTIRDKGGGVKKSLTSLVDDPLAHSMAGSTANYTQILILS